jgi:phosphatidylserine/phosphatidylglycerophosphate/cardiolipin synthase-like enzyme
MIIDDAFMTHGSANLNSRSMDVDSELNICHEHAEVTSALRQRLWTLHTSPSAFAGPDTGSGIAAGNNIGKAFNAWSSIISNNKKRMDAKNMSPASALVGFYTNTTTRSGMD